MALKLLLVEDDPAIQRMYEEAFTAAGFLVTIASDGTIVTETIHVTQPDIITLDVMMPNFNGLEALKAIKADPISTNTPVVMLSAYDDENLMREAMHLGATKYLLKNDYDPEQVADILKGIIQEKFGPQPTEPAPPQSSSPIQPLGPNA